MNKTTRSTAGPVASKLGQCAHYANEKTAISATGLNIGAALPYTI